MAERVFIAGALRTAIGKYTGSLKDTAPDTLAAELFKGLLKKTGAKAGDIDQVHLGCCIHCTSKDVVGPVIARQALLQAGLPETTLSSTVDRACTSSTFAIKLGFDAIRLCEADMILVGGTEVMSLTPHILRELRAGVRIGGASLEDPLYPIGYKNYAPVAVDAGEVALAYGVGRELQDQWAYESQVKYQQAQKAGKWKEEILPIQIKGKIDSIVFENDEFPKPHTTLERLATLPTVFGSPTITAGNAPGLNDGAAALILISESKMAQMGITPLAEIISFAFVADKPKNITTVPGQALGSILKNTKLSVDDLQCIEINEAFAALPLVSSIILGNHNESEIAKIRNKLNVNGGAIAMGHPVGASGARILVTLLHEIRRRGGVTVLQLYAVDWHKGTPSSSRFKPTK